MADGPRQSFGLHFVADRTEPIDNIPHHHHAKSAQDHVRVEANQPLRDDYPSLAILLNSSLPAASNHTSSTSSDAGSSLAPNGEATVTNETQQRSAQSTSHSRTAGPDFHDSVMPESSSAWRRPSPIAIATHNVSPTTQRINEPQLASPTHHSHSRWKPPPTHPPLTSAPPFFHPPATQQPGHYHTSPYRNLPALHETVSQPV
ncbi:hypothetical protein BJ742DRAFT_409647 [Cladochytrium replicatum]|nr:hypothetical protein BJ742DRAFT_409647 [Cladochytrium replicatum]